MSEASSSLTERRSFHSLALKLSDNRQVHDSFHQAKLVAHFCQIRIIGVLREEILDALQPTPGLLFLRRAERRHIVGFFDFIDPRLEVDALLGQGIEVGRRHDGIGLRHLFVVGLLAGVEHVVVTPRRPHANRRGYGS